MYKKKEAVFSQHITDVYNVWKSLILKIQRYRTATPDICKIRLKSVPKLMKKNKKKYQLQRPLSLNREDKIFNLLLFVIIRHEYLSNICNYLYQLIIYFIILCIVKIEVYWCIELQKNKIFKLGEFVAVCILSGLLLGRSMQYIHFFFWSVHCFFTKRII